jgi:hypothetical protein
MSAKVTIETPTERIIAKQKAQLPDHVIDEQGRVIKLRMPDALDEFDLSSALGNDSTNMACSAMAQLLLHVESIDGEPFLRPQSYAQIRAGIQRVGNHGMKAISEKLIEFAKEKKEESEQDQMNAIKK